MMRGHLRVKNLNKVFSCISKTHLLNPCTVPLTVSAAPTTAALVTSTCCRREEEYRMDIRTGSQATMRL